METVRLDVWLDVACLFKTRSEAQRACKLGKVRVNDAVDKPHREITGDALAAIERYPWPGNVRELRAAIERAVVMASGPKITLRDLPPTVRDGAAAAPTSIAGVRIPTIGKAAGHLNLQETESRMIVRALEETGGNVTKAAKILGISRRTMHRRIAEMREEEADNTKP